MTEARVEGWPMGSGVHPLLAGLSRATSAAGLRIPGLDRPWSEAWLLGLVGGLAADWQLTRLPDCTHPSPILQFLHGADDPARLLADGARRTGLRFGSHETPRRDAGQRRLAELLVAGRAALAWVDPEALPWIGVPRSLLGPGDHVVAVIGIHPGRRVARIDDRSEQPHELDLAMLAAARAHLPDDAHRLVWLEGADPVEDLPSAVREALVACAGRMVTTERGVGLASLRRWAELIEDPLAARGWAHEFPDGRGLFGALAAIHHALTDPATGGGSLRDLYATFLDEAGDVAGIEGLAPVADRFRDAARRWADLGAAALPPGVSPGFRRARELLDGLRAARSGGAEEGRRRAAGHASSLRELVAIGDRHFPLPPDDRQALLAEIRQRILAVIDAEAAAFAALHTVVMAEASGGAPPPRLP